MPPMTAEAGTPEPSRRPSASGRVTATPLGWAARASARPTQARSRPSSPLRNRWARTPPVARPLPGYSAKGVTFHAPGRAGEMLVAEAREVTRAGRSGLYDVSVARDDGTLVATFHGHSRTISGTLF